MSGWPKKGPGLAASQKAYVEKQQEDRRKAAAELAAAEAFLASNEPLPKARVSWGRP